jgi:putative membrane protein
LKNIGRYFISVGSKNQLEKIMPFLKLLHILFVFVWMGSFLTLTRLMGYQSKEEEFTQLRFARIYKRMYLFVDLPSMILAIGLGVALLVLKGVDFKAAWFHMKMTFVVFLLICDFLMGRSIFHLTKKPIKGSGVKYKILHGVTALCLIAILFSIYVLKQQAL